MSLFARIEHPSVFMQRVLGTPERPVIRLPRTYETVEAFKKMCAAVRKPVSEHTDETVRNIDMIRRSILSSPWKGDCEIHFPGKPIDRREFWYDLAQTSGTLYKMVESFLIKNTLGDDKIAVDLGCGSGFITSHLLQRNWKVIAVDYSRAIEIVKIKNHEALRSGKLEVAQEDITLFTPKENVDVVIAADSLSYTNPLHFFSTVYKIHSYIKSGGFFVGSLFYLTSNSDLMNVMEEMGAWFLEDRRMVRGILEHTGFQVIDCEPREGEPAMDFIAQKI